jgi:hypothetical protein
VWRCGSGVDSGSSKCWQRSLTFTLPPGDRLSSQQTVDVIDSDPDFVIVQPEAVRDIIVDFRVPRTRMIPQPEAVRNTDVDPALELSRLHHGCMGADLDLCTAVLLRLSMQSNASCKHPEDI